MIVVGFFVQVVPPILGQPKDEKDPQAPSQIWALLPLKRKNMHVGRPQSPPPLLRVSPAAACSCHTSQPETGSRLHRVLDTTGSSARSSGASPVGATQGWAWSVVGDVQSSMLLAGSDDR